MSDDNLDDLLPSGLNAKPYQQGDIDIGLPTFPEAVWIAQMGMRSIETGAGIGVAYRLMWGHIDDDGVGHLEGELWLEPQQAAGIFAQYQTMSTNETQEGG